MRRLPVIAFALLALATVAAFFLIQHLKVTTPLIAGNPSPFPSRISPRDGGTCTVRTPNGSTAPVSFRHTSISFSLLYRSDVVQVYVVNAAGAIVDTVSRGVFMPAALNKTRQFTWGGRTAAGRLAAPGRYYFRVVLRRQNRTINVTNSKGELEWVTVSRTVSCPGA
ncbi:MAG TPA: FlgD immunoglobulin-like domain containing protein [Solirubrobacteraceae bacterium]|nr:FlgD immunoglobulin-like domain containing protein [Solirubrobacteraceae bacterium]